MSNVLGQITFIERPGWLFHDELRMRTTEVLCSLRRVVPNPFRLSPWDVVEVLHTSVRGHDIGGGGYHPGVGFQFCEYMFLRVIGVENYHYRFTDFHARSDFPDDLAIKRTAF